MEQLYVDKYFEELKTLLDSVAEKDGQSIDVIIKLLENARVTKSKIFVIGNGGSAATASHFACDLNKTGSANKFPRYRAMALTDSIPIMTATANDMDYKSVFSEQLMNHMDSGDVLVAFTGSGKSKNVVHAVALANEIGVVTIAITGCGGGTIKTVADVCIIVPSNNIQLIEDVHCVLSHLITSMLRDNE